MKRIYALLLICIILPNIVSTQVIKGNIELNKDWESTIYILKATDFKSIKNGSMLLLYDSVKVDKNGLFEYIFKDEEFEGFYRFNAVKVGRLPSTIATDNHFYIIPSKDVEINVSGKINKLWDVSLKFSNKDDPNQELFDFTSIYEPLRIYYDSCDVLIKSDSTVIPNCMQGYIKLCKDLNQYAYLTLNDYKLKHTIIIASISLMQTNYFNENKGSYEKIKNRLLELDSNSVLISTFINFVEKPQSLINRKVEFNIKDINGKLITIDSINSKYILLDFWASWCTPCRRKNKTLLKELNSLFSNKQLCVVSISCDKDKQRWIKANKDDNITWISLCDLKGSKSQLIKDLQISAYPTLILLDQNKIIIRNNLASYSDEQVIEQIKALINISK